MVLLRIKAPHVADDQLILPDAQRLPHFLPDFRAVGILTGVDGVVQLLLGSLRFVLGPDGDFKRAVIIDVIVFAVSKLGFQLDLY